MFFVGCGHFVCAFLRNWEAGVGVKSSLSGSCLAAVWLTYYSYYSQEVQCAAWGMVAALTSDLCSVILFQSWGLKLTLSNRWAAAVGAAPQTRRAPQEAMTTALAAEARTVAPRRHSLHTSSPPTTGRPSPMEPVGHKEATSSWTPSVSVLSLLWLRAGACRPEMCLLFILDKSLEAWRYLRLKKGSWRRSFGAERNKLSNS